MSRISRFATICTWITSIDLLAGAIVALIGITWLFCLLSTHIILALLGDSCSLCCTCVINALICVLVHVKWGTFHICLSIVVPVSLCCLNYWIFCWRGRLCRCKADFLSLKGLSHAQIRFILSAYLLLWLLFRYFRFLTHFLTLGLLC